ncbi:MAG: hypothetical protein M3Z35_16730 [Nitrospirota bacterium]|nr:hypothetical protein [Nitrospirota bacterium]
MSRAGVFRYSPLANIADINPSISKMIVLDRDLSGVVVSTHNNEGFSGWNPPDPYGQRCLAGPPPSSSVYASAYVTTPFSKIWESATDGITDGNNVIQGRRTYDSKTSQWTGPDIYDGAAANPLTQKPYVWNANNALSFSDPTGKQVFPPMEPPIMPPPPFYPRNLQEYILEELTGGLFGLFTGLSVGAGGFGIGCAVTGCAGGEFVGGTLGFYAGYGAGYYGGTALIHQMFNDVYGPDNSSGAPFGNPDSIGQGGLTGFQNNGEVMTSYGDGSTVIKNPYNSTLTFSGPSGDVTVQPGQSIGFSANGLNSDFLNGAANNNALMSNDPMAYVHQSSFL